MSQEHASTELQPAAAIPCQKWESMPDSEKMSDARSLRSVCVFCGSNTGRNPLYAEAAKALGSELARRKEVLVYGGAQVGLMGIVADAALAAGGEVIGVMPEALMAKEVAHRTLSDLRVVGTMHERKALMAELSDAFVALPGGMGTFEEFCEVVTWAQIGLHHKPCILYNVAGYYDPLLALIDHAVAEQFIRPEQRNLVLAAATLDELFMLLESYRPAVPDKWFDK